MRNIKFKEPKFLLSYQRKEDQSQMEIHYFKFLTIQLYLKNVKALEKGNQILKRIAKK